MSYLISLALTILAIYLSPYVFQLGAWLIQTSINVVSKTRDTLFCRSRP